MHLNTLSFATYDKFKKMILEGASDSPSYWSALTDHYDRMHVYYASPMFSYEDGVTDRSSTDDYQLKVEQDFVEALKSANSTIRSRLLPKSDGKTSEGVIQRLWNLTPNFVPVLPREIELRGATDKAVVEGDLGHIRNSTAFVINVSNGPSAGASMEQFYAKQNGLPVILLRHPDTPVSIWNRYHADFILEVNSKLKTELARVFVSLAEQAISQS